MKSKALNHHLLGYNTMFAFVIVVSMAYLGVILASPAIPLSQWIGVTVTGIGYTLFGVLAVKTLCTRSVTTTILYFLVEILLGSLFMYWSNGNGFLIMMPIPSLAVFYYSRKGMVATCSAVIFGMATAIGLARGWVAARESLDMIISAVVFVVVFATITSKEYLERTESERLTVELAEANQKLREYALQAEELAVAKERNRMAREIHDTLGHYLTAIHMQIAAAKAVYGQDRDRDLEVINKVQSLVQESLGEVRRAVAALRVTPLEGKQLIPVLEELAEVLRISGVSTTFDVRGGVRRLKPQTELTLYRVVQEGLTNIRKHANAGSAQVILDFGEPDRVTLTIRDDGKGLASHPENGYGLLGLKERLYLCGGHFRTETAPGLGFALIAEVPE